jgi:phosphoribosylformylglycinamidine cyclo-ligase
VSPGPSPLDYRQAGVDIAAGEEAVARIAPLAATTWRPEVRGGIGGFGGCFALPPGRYQRPLLVASTDGVGTKLQVALAVGQLRGIGQDLVAMCVDDLVCLGAEPLFLLDYLAVGRLDPEQVAEVVAGVAEGCRRAGCALLGGETAEHPGVLPPGELDLAGFAVGVLEEGQQLGPERVRAGDLLVGLHSPGLRSNGYSLARAVLLERAGRDLRAPAWPGAPRSLADELLEPSRIYAPAVLAALRAHPGAIHAAAHITGGGIPGNLRRVLPPDLQGRVLLGRWPVPRIFEEIARLGPVEDPEMAQVFNLGLGMVLVVAPEAAEAVLDVLHDAGTPAQVVGEVRPGDGQVHLEGSWH